MWQYYPGQGIELQELGSFGKADGLYTAGPLDYPRMRHLLAELIPLAAKRAGGIAWEYYFQFDGGVPPWTSAMSQATALEALTRAAKAFADISYLNIARQALPIFSVRPPLGVSIGASHGAWYLLYSFAPGATVVNGFLQTLIGLYDFAHASGDPKAARLFAAGDAEARFAVPRYDTGAWSLYQPGQEDDLSYHELVTGFLHATVRSRSRGRLLHDRGAFRFLPEDTSGPAAADQPGPRPARRRRSASISRSSRMSVSSSPTTDRPCS